MAKGGGRTYQLTPEAWLKRIEDKFVIGDGCWEWTATKSAGYGRLKVDGRLVRAHRFIYEHMVGPVPVGMVLDHLCRNPGCVRPAHLEPVSPGENVRRSPIHNMRRKTHCPAGHPYVEENLAAWARQRGGRQCLRCHALREKARRAI